MGDLLQIEAATVARTVRKVRSMFDELNMMERLEVVGVLALMEGVEQGMTDQQLRLMFESMRDRFMSNAMNFRVAQRVTSVLRSMSEAEIARLKEVAP